MARINKSFSYLDGFRSGGLEQGLNGDHWSRIGDSFSPFAAAAPAAMQIAAAPSLIDAPVSLGVGGATYGQNFDGLSNTAGSTTNNLNNDPQPLPGWFMDETGGGTRDNDQYAVDTGGSTTGDIYSYGGTARHSKHRARARRAAQRHPHSQFRRRLHQQYRRHRHRAR